MSSLVAQASTIDTDFDEDNEAENQYLTFTLHDEIYALPILTVKEIIEYSQVTTVPMMPDFIRGVMNLRGLVVPVVDLAARFDSGSTEIQRRTSVIIVEVADAANNKQQDIGIMVDAVNEVIEVPPDQIEPPPPFGSGLRTDFIAGMARMHERFLIVLAIEKVLSVVEMSQVARTAVAAGATQ